MARCCVSLKALHLAVVILLPYRPSRRSSNSSSRHASDQAVGVNDRVDERIGRQRYAVLKAGNREPCSLPPGRATSRCVAPARSRAARTPDRRSRAGDRPLASLRRLIGRESGVPAIPEGNLRGRRNMRVTNGRAGVAGVKRRFFGAGLLTLVAVSGGAALRPRSQRKRTTDRARRRTRHGHARSRWRYRSSRRASNVIACPPHGKPFGTAERSGRLRRPYADRQITEDQPVYG